MVASLAHPLNIFILGLGGGFLIPLLDRLGKRWVNAAFLATLAAMTAIALLAAIELFHGAAPIEINTAGSLPPYSINLRMGLSQALAASSVGIIALLGAVAIVREKYAATLLYLLLVMGVQGMIMTRDLFNLFVFLEIVSVATYGLLALGSSLEALSATFKFLMATVIASTFFLLGTVLIYAQTGMLNIDDLLANRAAIAGPVGFAGLMLLLSCLLLELKPFPANGWGLDVYQTCPTAIAAVIASCVSAGVFFALYNLFPLFQDHAAVIAALGVATFLFSNLIGLTQTDARRLLGYSSAGQMGLLTAALALLSLSGAEAAVPVVVGGLFLNHLLAKAGLFWLAGYVGRRKIADWGDLARRPAVLIVFAVLLCALAGMPPFPGFFAKWQLLLALAADARYAWMAILLLGSLLEVGFLFRWLGQSLHAESPDDVRQENMGLAPAAGAALMLIAGGAAFAALAGVTALWLALPVYAGVALYVVDGLPMRAKAILSILTIAGAGFWLVRDLTGIGSLFAWLFYAGSLVLAVACLYRRDARGGFFPLLTAMLLALIALPGASTSLEFFFLFEIVTLTSYFSIVRRPAAARDAFRYLIFSIGAGYLLAAGFAMANAATGSVVLASLLSAGPGGELVFIVLAAGFLIKAAAIGLHVWLPGAYANAEDDVSAMLSALVSKMAIFGLLVGAYAAIRSGMSLNIAWAVGSLGMLTALAGAALAVQQDDIKRMLAYSSMSQLGYIVTAVALMSHLGWVTALYLSANHLMTKGILFLVAAAIIDRTGLRTFADLGGLGRRMPLTFVAALVAIVAMSGLPPLAGFGGKWLLLSAMTEKGWYGAIALGLLATFVGFVYMARFIQAIFLGAGRPEPATAREAPLAILASQAMLIAGILLMSFFPKLFIAPISKAIDPVFASTLVWDGMSLEMIYGYWNPVPTMLAVLAFCALLYASLRLARRAAWKADHLARWTGRPIDLHEFYRPILAALTPPLASKFWWLVGARTVSLAETTRAIYTGNGQTYALYVLYYFALLYAACSLTL